MIFPCEHEEYSDGGEKATSERKKGKKHLKVARKNGIINMYIYF
jgi:hypothetical protein